MTVFQGKNIVLGVTGSIAAFKAADLASRLTKEGAAVDVVMTEAAQRFVTPLTMSSLTHRPVATGMWQEPAEHDIEHISYAEAADLVLIAPATADSIAKLACGIAEDLLGCIVLATRAPVVIAPAMNDNMYANPVTRENIERLRARGFGFVESDYGRLASGKTGQGRLAEITRILGAAGAALGASGDMAGLSVVVTAGGTREPIDPVRYVGNRSSGKMGYALAEAARDRGARVTLISAAEAPAPAGVDMVRVETAAEMKDAVAVAAGGADVLVMAAAVADFRPEKPAADKIKKTAAGLELRLVPTADILREAKGSFTRVGFAAESRDTVANAERKLKEKGLDLIVANDITEPGSGFGSETNRVTIIDRDGRMEPLPLLTKREAADRILDAVLRTRGGKS